MPKASLQAPPAHPTTLQQPPSIRSGQERMCIRQGGRRGCEQWPTVGRASVARLGCRGARGCGGVLCFVCARHEKRGGGGAGGLLCLRDGLRRLAEPSDELLRLRRWRRAAESWACQRSALHRRQSGRNSSDWRGRLTVSAGWCEPRSPGCAVGGDGGVEERDEVGVYIACGTHALPCSSIAVEYEDELGMAGRDESTMAMDVSRLVRPAIFHSPLSSVMHSCPRARRPHARAERQGSSIRPGIRAPLACKLLSR